MRHATIATAIAGLYMRELEKRLRAEEQGTYTTNDEQKSEPDEQRESRQVRRARERRERKQAKL